MQSSAIPGKIVESFAINGPKNTIPLTTTTKGEASYDQGFPSATMIPLTSGGVPPSGQDMNGILNAMSAWQVLQGGGAAVIYDAAFSSAIGGYPRGAVLAVASGSAAAGTGWWVSTVEDNTSNPDTGGAGWLLLNFQQLIDNSIPIGTLMTFPYQSANPVTLGGATYLQVGTLAPKSTYTNGAVSQYFNPVVDSGFEPGIKAVYTQSAFVIPCVGDISFTPGLYIRTGAPGPAVMISGTTSCTSVTAKTGQVVALTAGAGGTGTGTIQQSATVGSGYSAQDLPSGTWADITCDGGTGNYLVVGNGANALYSSTAMTGSWTTKAMPASKNWRFAAAAVGIGYVAAGDSISVGTGGVKLAFGSTPAGLAAAATPFDGQAAQVTNLQYVGNLFFCVVTASGNSTYMTSPDGVTWTNRGATPLSVITGGIAGYIGWNGTYYTWSAGAFSPDGHTWTINPIIAGNASSGGPVVFNGTVGYCNGGEPLNFDPNGYVGWPVSFKMSTISGALQGSIGPVYIRVN